MPTRILSLIDPLAFVPTPGFLESENHLRLYFHDIVEIAEIKNPNPTTQKVAPSREDVERLLEFGAQWNGNESILVHCHGGYSRSPAAVFILACQKQPGLAMEIGRKLRIAAPHVVPNRLLIGYADSILNRQGEMMKAIESMPPAEYSMAPRWFQLGNSEHQPTNPD